MIKILVAILAVTAVLADYDIYWSCGPCFDTRKGIECFSFDGGPFENFEVSLPSPLQSCFETQLIYPVRINWNCGSGCDSDACGITLEMAGIEDSRCSNDPDAVSLV